MTDHMQVIRDDLAYMRALAEEGRRAPALGGSILLASGVIWASASLIAWAIWTRLLDLPIGWSNFAWLGGMLAFFIALFTLVRRHKGKPGHGSVGNRVMRVAWSAGGWSIFAFVCAVAAAGWRLHSNYPAMMIAPFVLTAYGVGWIIAGSVFDGRWMSWTGIGAFAAAVLLGFLAGTPAQYLAYAAALLLLMALPGWLLLRREPSTTV